MGVLDWGLPIQKNTLIQKKGVAQRLKKNVKHPIYRPFKRTLDYLWEGCVIVPDFLFVLKKTGCTICTLRWEQRATEKTH